MSDEKLWDESPTSRHIHNCWNLFFVPEPLWNSDNKKLSNFRIDLFYHNVISLIAVKWLPVKGGAWLRRFDDVSGVEKSCVAKSKRGKKVKEKCCIIATFIRVSSKHGIHGSLRCLKILYIHNCWNLFSCPRTVVKLG